MTNNLDGMIIVGEIDINPLDESYGGVGVSTTSDYPRFKDFKKCKVGVCGNKGSNIPHFHITGENIDCCIQIYDNAYFTHGTHKGTLKNNKNTAILDDWLRRIYEGSETKWEKICNLWSILNGDFKTNVKRQPDYTYIKPYK